MGISQVFDVGICVMIMIEMTMISHPAWNANWSESSLLLHALKHDLWQKHTALILSVRVLVVRRGRNIGLHCEIYCLYPFFMTDLSIPCK